jgi:hypothetical protein
MELRTNCLIEVTLGTAILVVAGTLGTLPPGLKNE